MNNKLILEISRQKKLMGLITEASGPGPISSWGGKLLKELLGTTKYVSYKSSFQDLFEKVKDLPSFSSFESKGIRTFEDFVVDAKKINEITPSGLGHKMTDSQYLLFVKDFVKEIFKEPNFRNLRQGIYDEYRNLVSVGDRQVLDELEDFAKNDDFASYNALKKSVQSETPPVFDPNILIHIESKFSKKVTPDDFQIPSTLLEKLKSFFNKKGMEFKTWAKGLSMALWDDNPIKQMIIKNKNATDLELERYFVEYEQIIQDFTNEVSKRIYNNKEVYLRRLDELSREIATGNKTLLISLWKDMKTRLPDQIKTQFEKPDGSLDIAQFREFAQYFDDISNGNSIIRKPEEFVKKYDAITRAFSNYQLTPGSVEDIKNYSKLKNFSIRLFRFLFRGTARVKAERELNRKIITRGAYKGYQVGELIMATTVYGPAIWALLKTFGDLLERNQYLPDWAMFDKENFTNPNQPESNLTLQRLLEVWWKNFNFLGFTPEAMGQKLSQGYAPGLFAAYKFLKELKDSGTGPITDREIIEGFKKGVEADTTNINRSLIQDLDDTTLTNLTEPDSLQMIRNNTYINLDDLMNIGSDATGQQ
jgi:hypothetical protein